MHVSLLALPTTLLLTTKNADLALTLARRVSKYLQNASLVKILSS